MLWIVENITKEPSYLELVAKLKEMGKEVLEINGDFYNSMVDGICERNIALFGSIEMVKLISPILRKNDNYLVNIGNEEKYLCSEYYPHFEYQLFNGHYIITLMSELLNRASYFFQFHGSDKHLFIRPNTGEKSFKGTLLELRDMETFKKQAFTDPNELIVISTPKNIKSEWRFVATNKGEVVTQSSYKIGRKHTRTDKAPAEAITYVRDLLYSTKYLPDKVFCVDIAEDTDGNFWLLELTNIASAGLYACDKTKIIEAVESCGNPFL